jgi:hypothetical protein
MTRFLLFAVSGSAALRFGCCAVLARDDAVLLSTRVPNQFYFFAPGLSACLVKDKAQWNIPLWACDPATLTVHTTNLKGAPYAVRIVTGHREQIWENSTWRRIDAIHLLAMSKEDALRMRKALIAEIEVSQRIIEQRQGNQPGFLKEKARAKK